MEIVLLGQSSIIHNHFTHATIISVTEKEKTIVASVLTWKSDGIIFCYYSIPLYFVIICIHCTLSTLLDTVAAALQTNIITWTNNVYVVESRMYRIFRTILALHMIMFQCAVLWSAQRPKASWNFRPKSQRIFGASDILWTQDEKQKPYALQWSKKKWVYKFRL